MARLNPYDRPIEKALDGNFGRQILERGKPVERRADLSPEEFDVKHRRAGQPVILTGLGSNWPMWKKWSFSFFKQHYGHLQVMTDVYSKKPSPQRFSDLIDRIVAGDTAAYLQEWKVEAYARELLNDFSVPPHFMRNWFRQTLGLSNTRLWLGPKNALTWAHQDGYGITTWNAQIVGQKQWFLFSPEFQPGNATVFEPFLDDPKTQATHFVTQPGDILFIPKGWWHRVRALEPSINLSEHILDEVEVPRFVKAMLISDALGWLNKEKLMVNDPGLVSTYQERARGRVLAMGLDPEDILGVDKTDSFNTATDIINKMKRGPGELDA